MEVGHARGRGREQHHQNYLEAVACDCLAFAIGQDGDAGIPVLARGQQDRPRVVPRAVRAPPQGPGTAPGQDGDGGRRRRRS
eukprot:7781807-Pyramimonas_sp.AAC.1